METFATITWCIEDVQAIRPDWDDEKCLTWWKENEKWFKDTLTQYGNEMLNSIL